MDKLDWNQINDLADRKVTVNTKSGIPFIIVRTTERTLFIQENSGNQYGLLRKNLEKAVLKINQGLVLNGPKDYREHIADDRPAYAWAILKKLGYIK